MGRSAAGPLVAAIVLALLVRAPHAGRADTSPARVANYTITADYDASAHRIMGRETLVWRNVTREAATDLYFHLYLNAFANSHSSFVREAGDQWVDWIHLHPNGWGYVAISSLRIAGVDLTDHLQFVHPDDDNTEDRTVVRLPLDTPVRPGRSVQIDVEFAAQLPRAAARSGYAGPFALVAQWFPKIGVYADGAWICHQYHLTTEFFADFGVYDVSLTVPRDSVVGATGTLRDQHENPNGTTTLHFSAEDVHDFAWAVDPRFRTLDRSIAGTQVRLLLQPNHVAQAERHFAAAQAALSRYRQWFGAYPYPQLTIVDPGPGGLAAGGMEYPTLITVGTTWWMPRGLRFPEFVTVHEFGHQYWYGMVANNEAEEAWLDEGINSFVEGHVMDEAYGPASYIDLLGLHVGSLPLRRLRYALAAQHDPITRLAWRFLDRSSYSAITYSKTALTLDTLDRWLGGTRLRTALAAYFEHWRYRHPRGADFVAAVNASVGEDLGWYFDQLLQGTEVLDYAVTRVVADELYPFQGHPIRGGKVAEAVTPEGPVPKQYHNDVVVERLGGVRMPVDVQITFDDGSSSTEHWDGRDRWKRFEYTGTQRVEWAIVDPNGTMPLDVNRLNNSRMRDGGTRGIVRLASRWGFWFQNMMYALTGF